MAQHHEYNVTIHDEVKVEVSTHHAWDTPRGEVYLQLTESGYGSVQVGLTPAETNRLADELIAAAWVAKTKPEASLTDEGERL